MSNPGKDAAKRKGLSAPIIGAIATVLAAVIAGVFTLIATSHSSNNNAPITTIQSPLGSGAIESQGPSSFGGSTVTFLADITPVAGKGPPEGYNIDFTDSVGGRAVIKTIGLYSGEEAEYAIPPGAKRFQVSVGVSDSNDPGNGVFTIFGDTTLLAQQNLNRGYLATISVSVQGYKYLRLGFVSPTASGGQLVRGDFGLARFAS